MTKGPPDLVSLATINATILTIVLTGFFLYAGYAREQWDKRNLLLRQLSVAARGVEKLRWAALTYYDSGQGKPLDYSTASNEIYHILKGRFWLARRHESLIDVAKCMLEDISALSSQYPLAEFKAESFEEMRDWARSAASTSQDLLAAHVASERADVPSGQHLLEEAKNADEGLASLISNLNDGRPLEGFMDNLQRVANIAVRVEAGLDLVAADAKQPVSRKLGVVVVAATLAAFVVGVLIPMLTSSISRLLVVIVPALYYLAALLVAAVNFGRSGTEGIPAMMFGKVRFPNLRLKSRRLRSIRRSSPCAIKVELSWEFLEIPNIHLVHIQVDNHNSLPIQIVDVQLIQDGRGSKPLPWTPHYIHEQFPAEIQPGGYGVAMAHYKADRLRTEHALVACVSDNNGCQEVSRSNVKVFKD